MENVQQSENVNSSSRMRGALGAVVNVLIIALFASLPGIADAVTGNRLQMYIPTWAFCLADIVMLAIMVLIGVWCMSRDSAFGIVLFIATGVLLLAMIIYAISHGEGIVITHDTILLISDIGVILSALGCVFLVWQQKERAAFILVLLMFLALAGFLVFRILLNLAFHLPKSDMLTVLEDGNVLMVMQNIATNDPSYSILVRNSPLTFEQLAVDIDGIPDIEHILSNVEYFDGGFTLKLGGEVYQFIN